MGWVKSQNIKKIDETYFLYSSNLPNYANDYDLIELW